MRIIDLSHPITHQMTVFPGDPAVGILTHQDHCQGYLVSQLILGTHAGTHVDAPLHRFIGGKSVADMGLAPYIGFRTCVLDLTGDHQGGPEGEFTAAFLESRQAVLQGCDALLLKTGWSAKWGSRDFFTGFPGLHEDTAEFLQAQGIHLLGVEAPSVHAVRHERVHDALLEREIAIVESLAGLDQIRADYVEFYALPLKLQGGDGSPVRAFAVER